VQSQKYVLRFCLLFLSAIICLLIFSTKLILIQFFRSDHLSSLARKQHNHYVKLEPNRGAIFDRRMRPLAINVASFSLYANPRRMTADDKSKAVDVLANVLHLERDYLWDRFNRNKYFIWIQRKLPDEKVAELRSLNLTGLDFTKESKRYYPNQTLAAHVLGFAGIDNDGLEGLELSQNDLLKGEPGWSMMLRDAHQRDLLIEKNFMPPRDGFNLILTIDETIQYIAERALQKAFDKHNARAGTVIVLDIETGEILALANRPTYNLSDARASSIENRTNRAIAFVYEPGSIFKFVTAAAALEEEIVTETDKFDCENGEYRVSNHILHDAHPYGILSFRDVIVFSSNIGTVKVAQMLGNDAIYKYGKRFRFGKPTGIDLLGEVPGYLKKTKYWSKTTIGAIPIGQEVTVTPLQMVCAMGAIANDGVFMKPFVLKYVNDNRGELIRSFRPEPLDRVISMDTARRLRSILQGVVEEGTGKRAQVKGIAVAGKTGTSQKVENGTYSHSKFYSSFVGFAPADEPRIAAIAVFDEPHPYYYGGTVAAPVFKEVVENTLKYLSNNDDNEHILLTMQE